jgi:hypothetical protein
VAVAVFWCPEVEMERSERFALFLEELNGAEPASTFEEARRMAERILNDVEDRYSGAPFNPANWRSDGRLYPPQDDRRLEEDIEGVRTFRTVRHYVSFADNGAIFIRKVGASPGTGIELDKPGRDGRRCPRKEV